MALRKSGTATETATVQPINETVVTGHMPSVPGRIGGTHEVGDKAKAPMTKDGYWERKEARDIETSVRIRRSGVWQAALQSVGVLQFNKEGDLAGLLKAVEEAANAGLAFINKND